MANSFAFRPASLDSLAPSPSGSQPDQQVSELKQINEPEKSNPVASRCSRLLWKTMIIKDLHVLKLAPPTLGGKLLLFSATSLATAPLKNLGPDL